MSTVGWIVTGVIVWLVVSLVLGLYLGSIFKRCARDFDRRPW